MSAAAAVSVRGRSPLNMKLLQLLSVWLVCCCPPGKLRCEKEESWLLWYKYFVQFVNYSDCVIRGFMCTAAALNTVMDTQFS